MNWGQLIPELFKTRKAIAIEMQVHGRTADTDRPLSYQALESDIAGALNYLKIDRANVLDYCLGGTVGYQFAISYPKMLNRLIVVSSVYKCDGWLPKVRNILQSMPPQFADNTPLKTEYFRITPGTSH